VFKVGSGRRETKGLMRGIVGYFLVRIGFSMKNIDAEWESVSHEQLKESMCGQSSSDIRLRRHSYQISDNIYKEICPYSDVNNELPMSHSTDDFLFQESIEQKRLNNGIRKFKLKN
jgi:hypothetical protein